MAAERRSIGDTVIAVTGAGSGIGRATAVALIDAGAKLVLGDVRPGAVDDLIAEYPDSAIVSVQMDATKPEDAERLVSAGVDAFGRLDSIVANAGRGFFGGITEWNDDDIRAMIDTNVAGTVWSIRSAVRQFDRQGDGGDIVIIASVAGLAAANAWEAVYASTKWAQMGLASTVAREVGERGIRVSTIAPAAVSTNFAFGTGRTEGDPVLDDYMAPSDIAFAVQTVLEQPRRMRTALWSMWSMSERP